MNEKILLLLLTLGPIILLAVIYKLVKKPDPPLIENMVLQTQEWLYESSFDERKAFLNSSKGDLVRWHHTIGQDIRNHYNLWGRSWTPDIVDGFDVSPDHPDQLSMRVIEEVWLRNRKTDG